MIVKSISDSQTEILKWISELYLKDTDRFECDPTYSKGLFYHNTGIKEPLYKYDICPQSSDVEYADARHLPLGSESINSMIFDPPFLATTGRSLTDGGDHNKINRRFGVYPNENALHQMYIDSLQEAYRVLKPNGILVFKCQDKVSSGKQYMSHVFIHNMAVQLGFYPKDLFILLAKNRLVAQWQINNQKHARKYHSYFWVLEKRDMIIQYTKDG